MTKPREQLSGPKATFTPDGLAKDYFRNLRNVLSSRDNINKATRDAETIRGKPDLDAIRKQLDEKGNPIESSPLSYTDVKRTADERAKYFPTTTRQNLSELELIAFSSAYFSAGFNVQMVEYNIRDPKVGQKFTPTLEQIRRSTAVELSSLAGFQNINTYQLKDGFDAKLNAIEKLVTLQITCQDHLENLKAKNPKSPDIQKISNWLNLLNDTKIAPEARIKSFLHSIHQERNSFNKVSVLFKKATSDTGVYGLWQKVKQDYKETLMAPSVPQIEQKATYRPGK